MKGSAAKIQMTGFDDLFGAPAPIAEGEHIQEVALSDLHPFKNHPFHVVDDERMQETAESVSKYGVLVPGIVRPRRSGGYEIVAGHRRKRASELAGKGTMPVIVRELDDDESTIIMVDSNLQREKILPSEKAFAYRMKLDAMKRKAGRPSKENSGPVGQNLSRNELAENSPDSSRQIQRYVRLTNLVSVLLDMVDSDRLKLRPAVEISYLSQEEQGWLADVIDQQSIIPSMEQAQKLREQSHSVCRCCKVSTHPTTSRWYLCVTHSLTALRSWTKWHRQSTLGTQKHEHMKWSEQHEKVRFGLSAPTNGTGFSLLANSKGTDRKPRFPSYQPAC